MRIGTFGIVFLLVITVLSAGEARVSPIPREVRTNFRLAPFYTKYVDAGGIPVIASDKVADFALLEARFLVLQLIGHRPDLLAAIARNRVRLAVMATSELTTDIPEHSDLTPKDHWDKRARGLGATEARPAVSCGEENLLGYPGDPYSTENILIHEFGHVIHERGLNAVDPSFEGRLRAAFDAARREGLWRGKYAGSNHTEYWAEGVQSWFDTNRENDTEHNHVNTRAELKAYDRRLAALLESVFGDGEWRYALPVKRSPASAHLAGFDASQAPRFRWPDRLAGSGGGTRDPAPAVAIAAALIALEPNARPAWRSVGGGKPTKIMFRNSTSRPVQLDWMDFEGRPKTYFTLRPGGQTESATYAGHIWRAKDERGTPLIYFVAGEEPGTAEVK